MSVRPLWCTVCFRSRRLGRHSPRTSDSCGEGSPVQTGSATINRESQLPGERAESPLRPRVKMCWCDSVRHLGHRSRFGRLSAFPAYFPDGVSIVATFESIMSRRIGLDAWGQFASMPGIIRQTRRDGSERRRPRRPAAAEPGTFVGLKGRAGLQSSPGPMAKPAGEDGTIDLCRFW
jgi:hypothetical protein